MRNTIAAALAMTVLLACARDGTRKSKTEEARQNVKKLYDGARAYYLDTPLQPGEHSSFPPHSVGPTPPTGTCCVQPGGLCPPNPALWTDDTWRQLGFQVGVPHRYSYQYIVTDVHASFTARALGDLDCDGELSTFEMYGTVNQ